MRRNVPLLVLVAAATGSGRAYPSPDKVTTHHAIFIGPKDGPIAPVVEEAYIGVKAALASPGGLDSPCEFVREDLKTPKAYDEVFAAADKRGVEVAFAYVPDGETTLVEKAAIKAKIPLIVLSPEATRPDLDPLHPVFWAGGLLPTDEALYCLDFLLIPLDVHRPAVFHDGSPRALEAASKCSKMCHTSQNPRAPAVVGKDFAVSDIKGLLGRAASDGGAGSTQAQGAEEGCDGFVYFGGPAGAERVVAAAAGAKTKAPVLLGQHLASRAVPTFATGGGTSAWALEPMYIEDYREGLGSPAQVDLPILTDAGKETGNHLYPQMTRGYRAARWVQEAWRAGEKAPEKSAEKKFIGSLRRLQRDVARGKYVFENWGHACLARLEPWRSAKQKDETICHRVKPTYVPMSGIPQVGFFQSKRFQWDGAPGSFYVWCHWGGPGERTIEKDMRAIGLDPGEGDPKFREMLMDDLMGRTMSRMNRLFLRNADGTAIPGVSFNVSFGTEPDPNPKKLNSSHKLEMIMCGDDPVAGGRAGGSTAHVFTTFIQRTMYLKDALKPPVTSGDLQYVQGLYKWHKSLVENMRGENLRALHDGFTQGFSLTGAHEVGHLFGCGHDTETPRSIMNVMEAVGLDFEWAEWIPMHLELLANRPGRVPAAK